MLCGFCQTGNHEKHCAKAYWSKSRKDHIACPCPHEDCAAASRAAVETARAEGSRLTGAEPIGRHNDCGAPFWLQAIKGHVPCRRPAGHKGRHSDRRSATDKEAVYTPPEKEAPAPVVEPVPSPTKKGATVSVAERVKKYVAEGKPVNVETKDGKEFSGVVLVDVPEKGVLKVKTGKRGRPPFVSPEDIKKIALAA